MNFIYKTEKVYCPVCKQEGFLGERFAKDWFVQRCSDCRVTYYFPPHKDIPTKVVTDRQLDNHCDCGSCKYRDNRT